MAADVIVFAKVPRPGTVKTRLAETLGSKAACEIYESLLGIIFGALASHPRVQVRFSPDDAFLEIKPWLRAGWEAQPQGAGDLGERMLRAFSDAFAGGASKVILIGADCPEVTLDDFNDASNALETNDLVLGPANDGGYWLIGMVKPVASLLQNMPWSSNCVLSETLTRAAAFGLRVHLLRNLSDIDTAEDWERYQQAKRTPVGTPAPN